MWRSGACVCPARCTCTNLPQQIRNKKRSIMELQESCYTSLCPHTSAQEYLHRCEHCASRLSEESKPTPFSKVLESAAFETMYFVNSVTLSALLSFISNRKAGCLTNSSGFNLVILQEPYVIPKNPHKATLLLSSTEKMQLDYSITAWSSSH